ncbi:MAG: methyltransferase domain-containing protein [Candidatus Lokiarchaeota archaeon]|nr:methyltransferase domain-containing protein [Candidatus Lokiarchaeota archaeon]
MSSKENVLTKFRKYFGEESNEAFFIQSVLDRLSLDNNAKVLDIGTGRGIMASILGINGFEVITGEPPESNWGDWKALVKKLNIESKVRFRPFRAELLPFSDNVFDAVFLYTSFHHINELVRVDTIKESMRVVKQGGYLVIIELNEDGVENVRKKYPSHQSTVDPGDYTNDLPFDFEIIEGKYLDAYFYRI